MKNELVITKLKQVADLLEILGESIYKIRAYRKAIESLNIVTEDIADIVKEGRLKDIPGIGDAISTKIVEVIETGEMYYLQKLAKDMPIEVTSLMRVEGIGGKTAGRLYKELGIKSISGLEEAVESGLLLTLSGFTESKVAKIKRALNYIKSERTPIHKVESIVKYILEQLRKTGLVSKVTIGGSFRRNKSTVRDLDFIGVGKTENFEKVMRVFCELKEVEEVIVSGPMKSTVKLVTNLNVDLILLPEESYGAGLLFSTGGRAHTIKLRVLAEKDDKLMNDHGLYSKDKSKLLASKTEEEVYQAMGMSFIPPELREDWGEIEVAMEDKLPKLIEAENIKGDLHIHTFYSDGKESIGDMVKGAEDRGWEYIAITDHFGKNIVYNPLNIEKLGKQRKAINAIAKDSKIKILHGIEVDITTKGKIDAPNNILKDLDFVIGAVHSHFNIEEEEMTNRILSAMDNEYVRGIAHPTGRMFGKRPGYKINFTKIAEKCKQNNIMLEINAQPSRQDIDDYIVHNLRDQVLFYIGTDAHHAVDLDFMKYGVNVARRGWCEQKNILNTYSYKDLMKKLGK